MKQFFSTLPRNLRGCFRGRMWRWHLLAVGLTFILVRSGFDWFYFCASRDPRLWDWMIPSAPLGGVLPFALPLILIVSGFIASHARMSQTGWAIGQAALLGSIISSAYKSVTGRVHPSLHDAGVDISQVFQFGFLRGGVFWGWPSSHTTIAFAMATTVFTLFLKQRWLGLLALAYAFYIGLGVSVTIHWFSDFIAGAIFGMVIGSVVGKNFRSSQTGQGECQQADRPVSS